MSEGVECARMAGTEAGPWRRAGEGRARKQSRKAAEMAAEMTAEMASQPDESPPLPVPSGRARKQSRKAAEMASQPDESPPLPVPSGRARKQSRKALEMASQPDESPPLQVPSPPTAAAAASLDALACPNAAPDGSVFNDMLKSFLPAAYQSPPKKQRPAMPAQPRDSAAPFAAAIVMTLAAAREEQAKKQRPAMPAQPRDSAAPFAATIVMTLAAAREEQAKAEAEAREGNIPLPHGDDTCLEDEAPAATQQQSSTQAGLCILV